jgi:hypothetical protein
VAATHANVKINWGLVSEDKIKENLCSVVKVSSAYCSVARKFGDMLLLSSLFDILQLERYQGRKAASYLLHGTHTG